MDKTTMDRIAQLHPKVRSEATEIYKEICKRLSGRANCRFTFTLRTFEEQAALYAQGRTKPGSIVTKADAGLSFHNYGLAIDIALIIDGKTASWDTKTDFDKDGKSDWIECVQVFKEFGWEWGGDWKFTDMPHFQKTFGKSVRDLLALHKAKQFIEGTSYVVI